MNTLQLVNSVLRRVREVQVTDFSAAYTMLILDFINETKREVEDAWDWAALRTTITVTTDTTNRSYSLVGAGQRMRFLNRKDGAGVSAYNTTNRSWLSSVNVDYILEETQIGNTTPTIPDYFAITGQDINLDPVITFGSMPNGIYTLKFNCVIPQTELSSTTTELSVPWYPVVLGAWAKAISERGEDGGQNTIEQWNMYQSALGDAIAQDAARLGEGVWQQI